MDICEAIDILNNNIKVNFNEDLNDSGKRLVKDLYKDATGYRKTPKVELSSKDRLFLKRFGREMIDEYIPQYQNDEIDFKVMVNGLVSQAMAADINLDVVMPAYEYIKDLAKEDNLSNFSIDDFINAASGAVNKVSDATKASKNYRLNQFKKGEVGDRYKEFPYYVSIYEHGAVYEPAEGGYYVDVADLSSAKGFQTIEEAQKYAEEVAQEYIGSTGDAWGSDLGDIREGGSSVKGATDYHLEGKYIGDGVDICVEDPKSLGKKEYHYHGYE